jgi:hypothetical protein
MYVLCMWYFHWNKKFLINTLFVRAIIHMCKSRMRCRKSLCRVFFYYFFMFHCLGIAEIRFGRIQTYQPAFIVNLKASDLLGNTTNIEIRGSGFSAKSSYFLPPKRTMNSGYSITQGVSRISSWVGMAYFSLGTLLLKACQNSIYFWV